VEVGALAAVRAGGRYTRVEREEPPGADGWARVVMLFEDDHSAREFILSYGPRVEVIEPDDLRAAIRDAARATVALYERRDEETP
jgi:predicted DNA-binding transcriptional regulator YafY